MKGHKDCPIEQEYCEASCFWWDGECKFPKKDEELVPA